MAFKFAARKVEKLADEDAQAAIGQLLTET